jgi:rare lipoprotein A
MEVLPFCIAKKVCLLWGMSMLRKIFTVGLLVASFALAGCSSHSTSTKYFAAKPLPSKNRFGESLAGFKGKGSPYYQGSGNIPRGGGKYHVGKPYKVAGKWFTPKEQPGYDRKGAASWYGEAFHRRKTSNGEIFDMNMLTAAHPTLPLPSYARVTNLSNGKVIVVRINDRGPFVGTRIIDMSKRSADALDFRHKGKANVRVQWIGRAPINDSGAHLAMMNRKAQSGAEINTLIAAAEGPARGGEEVQVAAVEPKEETGFQQAALTAPKVKTKPRGAAQIVQVGSFRSLENAEQARAALSTIGPVQVFEWASAEGSAETIYQVQLGPFISEIGAADALEAVRANGYKKAKLEVTRIEQVAYNN